MPNYRVAGPVRLRGTARTASAKNSLTAIMCAAAGIRAPVVLRRVPEIEEAARMAEILRSIGVAVERDLPAKTMKIDASGPISFEKIDAAAAAKVRSSLMLLGALAGRMKKFSLPFAGGCTLGTRTVAPHLDALEKLGVRVTVGAEKYFVSAGRSALRGTTIVMLESSDTATENAILAAVHAPGRTEIRFASANYMVQDLCHFLRAAGAKITGIGTSTLKIDGGEPLGTVGWDICPDPIDAMFWVAAAATTGSRLKILDVPMDFMELELAWLARMGLRFEISREYFSDTGASRLGEVEIFPSDLRAPGDKIAPRPYPGINLDNLPLFAPIATQAAGTTLIHDWPYENRAIYLAELNRLGAKILLADPHRVYIEGPTPLHGGEILMPPVLRMGPAFLIAMLAARGESLLRNVYPMERGYERLPERLAELGVQISRED